MSTYNHQEIESKWQRAWQEGNVFATPSSTSKEEKLYILDFFPYPSGAGLHVGHLLPYTATDIVARAGRMQGKNVLHPMGWDAFGLPAENYAIKSGVHPAISTATNIKEFKRQFSQTGISYDWSKEINTSEPEYYKWTQWFFSFLYERGLAYRKNGLVNWCPKCQTVLANEQVVHGHCERCDTEVVQKELKQWYFKITEYADRLLEDLEELDWPERIKTMQRNWIGRSEGAQVYFQVQGSTEQIEVFTTRPDTLFGAQYLVLAPEHSLVEQLTTPEQKAAVQAYQKEVAKENELQRTFTDREKTGVFTGTYAINPVNGESLPIWIADYVLASYGTGAIMAVPAHDERDYEFAKKFALPIKTVVEPLSGVADANKAFTEYGRAVNSNEFTGLPSEEAKKKIIQFLEQKKAGKSEVIYRLRDWLVSRQRFWGSPIPIVYDKDGKEHLLSLDELPVELPMDAEFVPTGQSPLVLAETWKKYINPQTGEEMTREVDTLDTFVCSSWYYLRFPTPHYDKAVFDPKAVNEWLPVDMYVGGAEHAVLHLLYARFFTKVLFDAGLVPFKEPFTVLKNQGMILGPDHNKMSKSKGNVVNPDEVVTDYGADTLRVYEMFMGPFDTEKPWSTQGIVGVLRFLERFWKLQDKVQLVPPTQTENQVIHKLTKKVTEDLSGFRFNTSVASMMETLNILAELPVVAQDSYLTFIKLLNPFAPHITEELWQLQKQSGFVSVTSWPDYDESFLVEETVEYPVQINGKVRTKIQVAADLSETDLLKLVLEDPKVQEYTVDKTISKKIVVPKRLVSLVVI